MDWFYWRSGYGNGDVIHAVPKERKMSHLRALGGAPLRDGGTMRLVYLDEAGIGNPEKEPFLVVAGVIVHADKKLAPLQKALDAIVERHIPIELRKDFSFHALELFNGSGKVFDRVKFPLAKRLAIADEIAALPARLKLPLAFGFVDREEFKSRPLAQDKKPKDVTVAAHVVAFGSTAIQIEMWMRTHAPKEVCLLVVEDNDQARADIKSVQKYHQRADIIENLSVKERLYFPLRTIKEDPLFQGKRASSALQLADFCAYVFKRFLMNQNDERYLRFLDPMRPMICSL